MPPRRRQRPISSITCLGAAEWYRQNAATTTWQLWLASGRRQKSPRTNRTASASGRRSRAAASRRPTGRVRPRRHRGSAARACAWWCPGHSRYRQPWPGARPEPGPAAARSAITSPACQAGHPGSVQGAGAPGQPVRRGVQRPAHEGLVGEWAVRGGHRGLPDACPATDAPWFRGQPDSAPARWAAVTPARSRWAARRLRSTITSASAACPAISARTRGVMLRR